VSRTFVVLVISHYNYMFEIVKVMSKTHSVHFFPDTVCC